MTDPHAAIQRRGGGEFLLSDLVIPARSVRRRGGGPASRGDDMSTNTTTFGIPNFGGEMLDPGDERYDEARAVFNAMIDRRPAMIAVCGSTADVVAAVNFAREQGPAALGLRRRAQRDRCGGRRRRAGRRPARHEGHRGRRRCAHGARRGRAQLG